MRMRRFVVTGVAVVLGVSAVLAGAGSVPASADPVPWPPAIPIAARLAGADRYGTSVAVAQAGFPDGAPVVFIASGENFPDALSAGPAAVHEGGPLLLTRQDVLPSDVADEITALKPDRIVIVGGTAAVSAGVEESLKLLAPSVSRIAGADRYATSLLVAQTVFTGEVSTVYVATGRDFPDALSAGPAAAKAGGPVLLVDGLQGGPSQRMVDTLQQLTPRIIIIVGGPEAVSETYLRNLRSGASATIRLYGEDRLVTSAAIANYAWDTAPMAYLASGWAFPDALVGSVLAGQNGDPLYVSYPGCQNPATAGSLIALGVSQVTLIGGTSVISDSVTAGGSTCIA